jgi:hypothetical protein
MKIKNVCLYKKNIIFKKYKKNIYNLVFKKKIVKELVLNKKRIFKILNILKILFLFNFYNENNYIYKIFKNYNILKNI